MGTNTDSNNSQQESVASTSDSIPIFKQIATVTILCIAHLLTQAALGQAIAPLHVISNDLGSTSLAESSWYVAAYSLTVGTFILIAGRFGDVYGHRLMVTVGYVWFALWSLICGFSVYSGQVLFIVSRAFQGIGPAILLPNSLAILGNMFPPGLKKNITFSLFAAAAPNGFILGSLFSSIFAQLVWWPWAYWVMGIVCTLMAFLVYLVVPSQPSDKIAKPQLDQLDLLGSITGVVGLVLVNFSWNQAAVVGWPTHYTYALLIIGAVFLILFFYIEAHSSCAVVPVSLLTIDTVFVLICIGCGWSSFGIWLFYAWQVSEDLRGYSPLSTVAQFTPVGISGFLAAFSIAYLLGRLGPYYIMTMAMLAFLVGSILFGTAPVHQSYWAQTFVSILVMPWGMVCYLPLSSDLRQCRRLLILRQDLSYPSGTILLSNATSCKHQGVAASLMNTVVNYSVSIGLGIAGTVESQIRKDGTDPLRGYRSAQYIGIGLSGLGLGVSLLHVLAHKAKYRMIRMHEEDGETP